MRRSRPHRNAARRATMAKALAAASLLASLMLLPDQALGDNCLDRVQQMAAAYDTQSDPPTIPPGEMNKPLSTNDLARSGGVVEPPATQDRAVITPPPAHSGMPTLPDVVPKESKGKSPDKQTLDPAKASALQALLVAARDQAERGMEAECLDGLRKAQELVRKP